MILTLGLVLASSLSVAAAQTPKPQPVVKAPELPESAWAHDVCFPAEATIVIAARDGRSHTSRDGGKTWTSAKTGPVVDELTIDARGVIWGLCRSLESEVASRPSLVWSHDVGTTWHAIELDPKAGRPAGFVTTHRDLALFCTNGQLWKHAAGGDETLERWSRWGTPNPDAEAVSAIWLAEPAVLVSSSKRVWRTTDSGATWTQVESRAVVSFDAVPSLGTCGVPPVPFPMMAVSRDAQRLDFTAWYDWDRGDPEIQLGDRSQKGDPACIVVHASALDWRVGPIERSMSGQLVVCGGRSDGTALADLLMEDSRRIPVPGVAGHRTFHARTDLARRSWIVGKGVYQLAARQDRWELVWPKP